VWSTPVLQPFITHGGSLVFFSPLTARNKPVAELIAIKQVTSLEEYNAYDQLQPPFITQVQQLKLLHQLLPEKDRFRETDMMVEVLKRLEPFLPGGTAAIEKANQQEQKRVLWV